MLRAARRLPAPCRLWPALLAARGVHAEPQRSIDTGAVPHVLYKGPLRRLFRLLVRFKVAQLSGVAAAAAPIAALAHSEALPPVALLGLGALVSGAGAASGALYYYSRRYVGELALLPRRRVRVSSLDFWGGRQELEASLLDVRPPFQDMTATGAAEAAQQPIVSLEGARLWESDVALPDAPPPVVGQRQFILFPRYGTVVDGPALMRLLDGSLLAEARKEGSEAMSVSREQ